MELERPTPREIILNSIARNRQVIYGQQATNFQIPSNLRKETKDFDILTRKPKESAENLTKELNKYYPNRYKISPAKHKKTFHVKDLTTKETIADYTGTTKKPKSYNELGVRYVDLSYSKKKLKQSIKNPNSSFRHEKDKDTLARIKKSKRFKL